MGKPGEIDIEISAKELGLDLEKLATELEDSFNNAIEDIANATFAKIMANAQKNLHDTRADYIKGLDKFKIGEHSYLIVLEGDFANKIENGFPGYDMRDTLLQSQKTVGVGSRAGQPWVRKGKDGQKFASVPFEVTKKDIGQLISALKQHSEPVKNQRIKALKDLMKTVKDDYGKPIEGKVASIKASGANDLEGLIKYQFQEGKKTASAYVNYRTISEKVPDGWHHRGYKGAHFFDEAEKWAQHEIDKILKDFLK